MSDLDKIAALLETEKKPPEGAFTCGEYVARFGGTYESARKKLNRKADNGEIESDTFHGPKGIERRYWIP